MNYKDKLIHAVTAYDRKQSKKDSYNGHALGIYFMRVDEVCQDIESGSDLRKAITAGFSGRLADACLKSVGLTITTNEEARNGSWFYQSANNGTIRH